MIKKMRYILCLLLSLSSCSICLCVPDLKGVSTEATAQQQQQPMLKEPASASEQADFAPAVFPNYFSFLSKENALVLIDKSIASVLSRLQIPYIDPARPTKADGTPNILKDGFFITLEGMIHAKDPGAKVYISGGVIRSILGYIYKKLYHDHQRALAGAVNRADVDMEALVAQTFDRVIDGHSRKEEPLMFHGHYISQRPAQDVDMLTALGIGSDLDILVKFSDGFQGDKHAIMRQATDFINSAEHALGLRDDTSSLKKSIVPIGDVKDYDTQVGTDRSGKNSVAQGGSSLDWLAFPVSIASGKSMVMPIDYQQIMHHFMKGELDYIPSPQQPTPDKQTIRGLRALLELPFLNYTANGFKVIKAELDALIAKGSLDHLAQEQIGKMIRNARFEGAKNRFSSSIQGVSAETIEGLVQQLAAKNSSVKIPEFMVKNDPALRHGADKGGLAKAGILMPVEVFIAQHTDQGVLYHGTPDFTNVLNMIRNGMVISKAGQGLSAYGRGVYTDKTRGTPETYAKDTGVVLELRVQPESLRVLDWEVAKSEPEILRLFPNAATASGEDLDTLFETLARDYDIDIIINSPKKDPYPLIQNAAAIKLPKKTNDLIKLQIQQAENSLKAYLATEEKPAIGKTQIMQWFNYLHPKGQFAGFAHVIGIQLAKDMHAKVNSALRAYLAQDADVDAETVYSLVLSHDKTYWNTQEEQEVYAAAFNVYKQYIENSAGIRPIDDIIVACIIDFNKADFQILNLELKNLIPVLRAIKNAKEVTGAIIELAQTANIFIAGNDLTDLIEKLGFMQNAKEIMDGIIALIKNGMTVIDYDSLKKVICPLGSAPNVKEMTDNIIALINASITAIDYDNLPDVIDTLNSVSDVTRVTNSVIALTKQTGISIDHDNLPDVIDTLNSVSDVTRVTNSVIALTEQTGILIDVYNLTHILHLLSSLNNMENVVDGAVALKKMSTSINDLSMLSLLISELSKVSDVKALTNWIIKLIQGTFIEPNMVDLQNFISEFQNVKNGQEITDGIIALAQTDGITVEPFNLRYLISALALVNNVKGVTDYIIEIVQKTGLSIGGLDLEEIIPLLNVEKNIPEIIKKIKAHEQETGKKIKAFSLKDFLS